MSGRFTPAAATRIRIWPGPGAGVATLTGWSAEGSPLPPSTAIAVMVSGVDIEAASRRSDRSDTLISRPGERGAPTVTDEPVEPRRARGAALVLALREDLDPFAREDLEERIAALESEIARVRLALEVKAGGRAAAEALFS